MKAICMSRTGEPEVLELVEVATPVAGPGQALVKAHTIGVNMPEVHVRRGRYSWMPPLPVIPGIEMSGTIEALGSDVRDFSVGQPVYVSARELPHRCGCYAEYIAVDTKALLALPREVDLEAAATLSSYQVAWHLLNSATRGFEYESVLITAAAGGIGSACVQLAMAAGKRVIALVSSEAKAAFARGHGAHTAVIENEGCVDSRCHRRPRRGSHSRCRGGCAFADALRARGAARARDPVRLPRGMAGFGSRLRRDARAIRPQSCAETVLDAHVR
jgi:NADPH2:quinone reductase